MVANSQKRSVDFLQTWYSDRCDGDWEHEFGIKITTIDNPGWLLEVDLVGTDSEGFSMEKSRIEKGRERWMISWSDGKKFRVACDPLSLSESFVLFESFVENSLLD